NLGQGACQALEDAVTLSRLLSGASAAAVPAALARYSALRVPRAQMIVKRSRQAGRLTTWTSPAAVAVRNALVTALGKIAPGAALAGVGPVFDWRPPAPPPAPPPNTSQLNLNASQLKGRGLAAAGTAASPAPLAVLPPCRAGVRHDLAEVVDEV